MAGDDDVTVASNVLGTIGTNWRRKKTNGLPPLMMFLWAALNLPLQSQPPISGFFSLVSWASSAVVITAAVLFGGMEAILTLRACWVFLSIDPFGGLGSFDILGGLIVFLEGGIYASHIIGRIRSRAVRKEAKATGPVVATAESVEQSESE
ncbi:uncharacterized protein BP01DRAFT_418553 [Aspergillus saccharolyticus JOP 1030-1]|uniref:Uncharacterized protein n=1 Tax=Aspergillus saccharolyticus JOP 1030-1 TaxID=1450539 RepID=A0A319A2J2_9EURO|nr:hypothetical protein BP01DRAFT_418553 [Aspergillus saccharolyticus JOP 1030-1]PYH41682.1 hypothetical protein BP01DRAFT_418553 [Aspergillus saccharolyticus JOP 1030-1]